MELRPRCWALGSCGIASSCGGTSRAGPSRGGCTATLCCIWLCSSPPWGSIGPFRSGTWREPHRSSFSIVQSRRSQLRVVAATDTKGRRLPPPGRLVRLWPRVRRYKGMLALATLTLVLSALIGLAFPMVVRYLLDAAFIEQNRKVLDRIAVGLVLLFTIQAVLNYAQTYLLSAVGERVVAGLRQELFGRLLDMPPGFFAERRTGELTRRLTTDIGLLQGVLSHQIAEFSRQILALVGGIILLTLMQPRLTLTALGVVPLVVGSALFFGRRLRRMTTSVQDKVADATASAEEAFSQIRTVQSFVQEPAERKRYGERIGESVRAALVRAQIRGVFFGVLTFSTFVGIVIVLWQGGLLVLEGQLTPGELVQFLLYTITIAAAIGA